MYIFLTIKKSSLDNTTNSNKTKAYFPNSVEKLLSHISERQIARRTTCKRCLTLVSASMEFCEVMVNRKHSTKF